MTDDFKRQLWWKKERHTFLKHIYGLKETHQESLCNKCRTLDVSKHLLQAKWPIDGDLWDAISVCKLTPAMKECPCHLCRLFGTGIPFRELGASFGVGRVCAFSSILCHSDFPFPRPGSSEACLDDGNMILGTVERLPSVGNQFLEIELFQAAGSTLILPVASSHSPRYDSHELFGNVLDPAGVDYGLLNWWLTNCELHHNHDRRRKRTETMAAVKLLDCVSNHVVHVSGDEQYLALSYVLGDTSLAFLEHNGSDYAVPASLTLIRDAMEITKELGLRYLWVDQFCIEQSDKEEKQAQILKMDQIYEESYATIVAAASINAEEGMPGVSRRARKPQPFAFSSDGSLLVSSMTRLEHILKDCRWVTRAWTYQEFLLSRRCLIFTDEQVQFACATGNACESVIQSMKQRRCKTGFAHTVGLDMFDTLRGLRNIRNENDSNVQQYKVTLNEYSSRSLTFHSDRLNAFRDLLAKFDYATYWVIPLLKPICSVKVAKICFPCVNVVLLLNTTG